MTMMMKATVVTLAVALTAVEWGDAAYSCENRIDPDLGTCDMTPGPHPRTVVVNATVTGTIGMTTLFVPQAISGVFDAEHYAVEPAAPAMVNLSTVPPLRFNPVGVASWKPSDGGGNPASAVSRQLQARAQLRPPPQ
jgi:hypothetical protein